MPSDDPADEERRAQLDAFYFHKYGLYGVTAEETRYMLDPKAVYGEGFPGETFRVLKENERMKFGEYRTQQLVLEYYRAWRDGDMSAFDRWLSARVDRRDLDPGHELERKLEEVNKRPTERADWWHQQRRGRSISNPIRRG